MRPADPESMRRSIAALSTVIEHGVDIFERLEDGSSIADYYRQTNLPVLWDAALCAAGIDLAAFYEENERRARRPPASQTSGHDFAPLLSVAEFLSRSRSAAKGRAFKVEE